MRDEIRKADLPIRTCPEGNGLVLEAERPDLADLCPVTNALAGQEAARNRRYRMPRSAMVATVHDRDDLWALPGIPAVSALVLASGEMTGAWGDGAAIARGLLGREALYSIPAWRACGPSIAALVVSSYSCQCVQRCAR